MKGLADEALHRSLQNAMRVPLTEAECEKFDAAEKSGDHSAIGRLIAAVAERSGVPMQSGRVAYASMLKCLLVVA